MILNIELKILKLKYDDIIREKKIIFEFLIIRGIAEKIYYSNSYSPKYETAICNCGYIHYPSIFKGPLFIRYVNRIRDYISLGNCHNIVKLKTSIITPRYDYRVKSVHDLNGNEIENDYLICGYDFNFNFNYH